MMAKLSMNAGVLAIAACLALSACSGSTSPTTPATPQPTNISGDYTGTMIDAQGGSGTATATLAQRGSTAGGAITDTQAGGTITAQISLTIASSNAFKGAMVVDYTNGTTCTFSTTGTYDTSTNVLAGSYTAVTNCTNDSGTYSLTQQCTDTITNGERRDVGGITSC